MNVETGTCTKGAQTLLYTDQLSVVIVDLESQQESVLGLGLWINLLIITAVNFYCYPFVYYSMRVITYVWSFQKDKRALKPQ